MLVRPIIVNYNGYADTVECLTSLKAQDQITCLPLVIDNASVNDSVNRIKAAHPDVELVVAPSNLGFAGGNNLGIRHALESGCDYLFLVNNDTVLEPDCVQKLVTAAETHPNAAVVGPAIYYNDDRTKAWFTGSDINMLWGEVRHSQIDVRTQPGLEPFEVPWTTGCAMLVPVAKMRAIGLLDERYFCYFEDTDWSFRARRLGYSCLLCPSAVLYHKVSSTTGQGSLMQQYYMTRNGLLFFTRFNAGAKRLRVLASLTKRTFNRQRINTVGSREKDRMKVNRCALLATLDFYLRRYGECRHSW